MNVNEITEATIGAPVHDAQPCCVKVFAGAYWDLKSKTLRLCGYWETAGLSAIRSATKSDLHLPTETREGKIIPCCPKIEGWKRLEACFKKYGVA